MVQVWIDIVGTYPRPDVPTTIRVPRVPVVGESLELLDNEGESQHRLTVKHVAFQVTDGVATTASLVCSYV